MATPLHHDQPQRAPRNIRINPDEHAESSKTSRDKKKSTSPFRHDGNVASQTDSLHRRGAQQLPPLPVLHRETQQHLRQRRPESSSPHTLLQETLLNSSPSNHLHARRSLKEPGSSYPDHHIEHARNYPEECWPSYPDHLHAGSPSHYVGIHNNQIYGAGNKEALSLLQDHPPELQIFDALKPIYNCIQNSEGERRQASQNHAPQNPNFNYRAAVLREVPVSHTLKHHQHANDDNHFGCTEDNKQQTESTSLENTLFHQQQHDTLESSGMWHFRDGDKCHAATKHVQNTEGLHVLASFPEISTQRDQAETDAEVGQIDSEEQSSQANQQLHRELSQSSSDDSFCHISKEAVEQEYQNDCHIAAPFDYQEQDQPPQPCPTLVYDYSRAGVTLVKDSSKEEQSDSPCINQTGVLNDQKGTSDHVHKIAHDSQRGHDAQQQDVESPPLFLGFNYTSTRFACGTSKGFRVYDINTMRECFSCMIGGVGFVEFLLITDTFIIVGGGPNPSFPLNSVVMWDVAKGKCIAQLSHKFPVLAVKARQDRLVVVLEDEVYAYNFSNAKLLFQVHTVPNIKGLCALSVKEGPSVLACPGLKKGEVRIEHIGTSANQGDMPTRNSILVSAHDSGLACIVLNSAGSLLATSSVRGTLVRLFSAIDGAPLQELRRGSDRAEIYSLAFSFSSDWLAVSSDKGTVHLFGVRTDVASSLGNGGSTLSFFKGVLPKYFRSEWSYAQFKLPEEMKYIVSFEREKHSIFVLGSDGSFRKLSFDPEHGGDMKQLECVNFFIPSEQKLD